MYKLSCWPYQDNALSCVPSLLDLCLLRLCSPLFLSWFLYFARAAVSRSRETRRSLIRRKRLSRGSVRAAEMLSHGIYLSTALKCTRLTYARRCGGEIKADVPFLSSLVTDDFMYVRAKLKINFGGISVFWRPLSPKSLLFMSAYQTDIWCVSQDVVKCSVLYLALSSAS